MAKRLSIVNILSCVWILFMALYSSSSRGDCLQGRSSWCYLAFDSYLHKTSKHFPTTTTSTNVVSCCLSNRCISAYLPQLAWEKSISLPTYLPVTLVISQSTRFTFIMINIIIPGFDRNTKSVFTTRKWGLHHLTDVMQRFFSRMFFHVAGWWFNPIHRTSALTCPSNAFIIIKTIL